MSFLAFFALIDDGQVTMAHAQAINCFRCHSTDLDRSFSSIFEND
jgi:hypothetical protein